MTNTGVSFSSQPPGGSGTRRIRAGSLADHTATRSLRIVIADDDADSVLTLTMLLNNEGHEVRAAYSGRQVLESLSGFEPHAILLDIALPELSGWEVARSLRKRHWKEGQPLIIGISGEYIQGADRILSEIMGFDHYLIKPYAPATLLALLAPLSHPGGA